MNSSARRCESLELRNAPDEGHLPTFEEGMNLTARLRALGSPTGRLAFARRFAAAFSSTRFASTRRRLQFVRLHYDFNSST
jgi:hypothetical protein